MAKIPFTLNGRGVLTVPFFKVGVPAPDLAAILAAVGNRGKDDQR